MISEYLVHCMAAISNCANVGFWQRAPTILFYIVYLLIL